VACQFTDHKPEHNAVQNILHRVLLKAAAASPGDIEAHVLPDYISISGLQALSAAGRQAKAATRGMTTVPKFAVEGDLIIKARADATAIDMCITLIDVVVASPPFPHSFMAPNSPTSLKLGPYSSTKTQETRKENEFHTSYNIEAGSRITFRPFGISHTGFLGQQAEFLLSYISKIIDTHGAADSSRHLIHRNLQERISVALHAGIGERIRNVVAHHRRLLPNMPLLPMLGGGGPMPGAGAVAAGAAALGAGP